jgi:sodium-dependent dicarboxylate transporter 2/3/5
MSLSLTRSSIFKIAGPLAALLVCIFCDLSPGNHKVTVMAAITLWMCIWWFSEAVGFGVTAMVPVLMLPLTGIANVKDVAQQYSDSIIFLFIGGFMIAFAIEKWNLHRRIALKILSVVGTNPSAVLAGVMLSAYLISNWVSNTATTMMLFGAVFALIQETKVHLNTKENKLAPALLLGLAFSATIGGMATPVGTPPNMYFFMMFRQNFPGDTELNFVKWSAIGYPISFILLVITFAVLRFYYLRGNLRLDMDKRHFRTAYQALGRLTREESYLIAVIAGCILLWFTRADIDFGSFKFTGWNHLFPVHSYVDDSIVAIAAALLLFLIPSKENKGEALLIWDDAKKLRYDIILMFGSGFALAYGFEISGLSVYLAESLRVLEGVPPLLLLLCICMTVTVISEFASNIASVQLVIPVMMALHKDLGISPLLLMMPVTFAASLGFMLPVATAANTIVFGTREINIRDMLRIGLVLDILGVLVISILCYLYLSP